MLNIIISGAPGCGKGTQSALIIEQYGLQHFSTGDMLRKEIAEQTEMGREAERYISKGNLVPDQMIIDIITATLKRTCRQCKGIILDGFPRTVEQGRSLEELMDGLGQSIDLMLDIQVPKRELINRLLIRGETSERSDDNLETIIKRLEVFEVKTAPVIEYYQSLNKYRAIDGLGTMEDVFARIKQVIDTLKK